MLCEPCAEVPWPVNAKSTVVPKSMAGKCQSLPMLAAGACLLLTAASATSDESRVRTSAIANCIFWKRIFEGSTYAVPTAVRSPDELIKVLPNPSIFVL